MLIKWFSLNKLWLCLIFKLPLPFSSSNHSRLFRPYWVCGSYTKDFENACTCMYMYKQKTMYWAFFPSNSLEKESPHCEAYQFGYVVWKLSTQHLSSCYYLLGSGLHGCLWIWIQVLIYAQVLLSSESVWGPFFPSWSVGHQFIWTKGQTDTAFYTTCEHDRNSLLGDWFRETALLQRKGDI